MLELLIPLYISMLEEPETLKRSADKRTLQDSLLQKLTAIGRSHPQPFKAIMTPELRSHLERAIKGSQARGGGGVGGGRVGGATQSTKQPSIALTMDFSKFK